MTTVSVLANLMSDMVSGKGENLKAFVATLSDAPSRETVRRIIAGKSVKLRTLRALCVGLKVSEPQWLEFLAAWIQVQLGPEAKKIRIEPASDKYELRDSTGNEVAKAMMLFRDLPPRDRKQIVLAMQRPPAIASLVSINEALNKVYPQK